MPPAHLPQPSLSLRHPVPSLAPVATSHRQPQNPWLAAAGEPAQAASPAKARAMQQPSGRRHRARQHLARLSLPLLALLLAGCQLLDKGDGGEAGLSADRARDTARRAIPASVKDRDGWAADIQTAFSLLGLPATTGGICATVAIIGQESGFQVNPVVAGLPAIAWKAIDERAGRYGVPAFMVRGAMQLPSGDGRSYAARIDSARTEQDLSRVFEDMISSVPLGKKLFGRFNPVRTGGAMQVSIDYAEAHARQRKYPYADAASIREEVFSRRGGLYFGIAHLLDYPATYPEMRFRFADFNAGHYASRNAAFQRALAVATGQRLSTDGDLINHAEPAMNKPGQTERAARLLGKRIGIDDEQVRAMLQKGDGPDFEKTALYKAAFAQADSAGAGRPMPRALVPDIQLDSPKITRKLTTAWFADRVETRYQDCLKRVNAGR